MLEEYVLEVFNTTKTICAIISQGRLDSVLRGVVGERLKPLDGLADQAARNCVPRFRCCHDELYHRACLMCLVFYSLS